MGPLHAGTPRHAPGRRTRLTPGPTARRTAGLAVVLGSLLALVLATATPAHAASGVFVTVNPSTITAGGSVTVAGSCGENVNSATADSGAFATPVTLTPVNGVLNSQAVVPHATAPQGYTVTLTCASGNTATTTLWVVSNTTPSKGPATGGGGTSGDHSSTLLAAGLAALLGAGALAIASRRRRRVPAGL